MNHAFISEDNGLTWDNYFSSFPLYINRMAILPDGTILIGIEYNHPLQIHNSGLFRSTDDGYSWTRVIPDLSTPTSVEEEQPVPYALVSYPNPFNATTKIPFRQSEPAWITIKIHDIRGRQLVTLFEGNLPAGRYEVEWNSGDFSSGIYLYSITARGSSNSKNLFSDTGKLTLIK